MSNYREVNENDFFSDWVCIRDEYLGSHLTPEDKNHHINFDEISDKIIKNVPNKNKKYVKKLLEKLYDNFMEYVCYWNEKHYRNGFCDGVELIVGCLNK